MQTRIQAKLSAETNLAAKEVFCNSNHLAAHAAQEQMRQSRDMQTKRGKKNYEKLASWNSFIGSFLQCLSFHMRRKTTMSQKKKKKKKLTRENKPS